MDLSRTLARSPLILWPKRHLWKTVLYVLLMTAWTQESTADTTPLNSTSPSQVYYPIETQNYFEWKIFKVSRIVPFWTKKMVFTLVKKYGLWKYLLILLFRSKAKNLWTDSELRWPIEPMKDKNNIHAPVTKISSENVAPLKSGVGSIPAQQPLVCTSEREVCLPTNYSRFQLPNKGRQTIVSIGKLICKDLFFKYFVSLVSLCKEF